jgi:hypothetical protein
MRWVVSTVFISYRRQTAPGEARALFNDLASRLGKSSVFMDVDSIALGRDFRSVLRKTLESCDLMLVVIDKNWVEAKDEEGKTRLKNPNDFVRMEVEAALKRDIAVTPILVEGARMPTAEELPREIEDLAYRNAFELTHNRWESDVQELVRRLDLVPPERAEIRSLDRLLDVQSPKGSPEPQRITEKTEARRRSEPEHLGRAEAALREDSKPRAEKH